MDDRVGQQFGNYRLLRHLGAGSFASVYLGEHQYLERPAAVKVLHVHMGPKGHEAFLREAHTIAHLDHPHIVRVLDFGIEDQIPYLVMEYMQGGTLEERVPKGARLPLEQIVIYVKQIASALDYAHGQHVIHRDVKPGNLLLNAKGEVVLSDFGIAVVQDTLASLAEEKMAGTPRYMAPELIQHQPCAASDQYALGVIVYEWLCGEPPFGGPLMAVLGQHLHQAPPSLCARLPHLPASVEDTIFGSLAKDPHRRFPTVQEFVSVLEETCFATQPLHTSIEAGSSEHGGHSIPSPAPMTSEQNHAPSLQSPVTSTVSPTMPSQAISQRPLPLSVAQRNRQTLLRRVRSFWIEGVLNHSLHGATLMTLGLKELPDAVANPWHLMLQYPGVAPRPLPEGTRITEVYDGADGELLILGAPGAGKTTLLLELARDLLERAERDEQHPMPVVFNLSSWATKRQRLTDWLMEELNSRYLIPRKLAQALVGADQILPLLDGLDEVVTEERTACIEAINTYRLEHGLRPLVVCSRSADYLAQTARVRLGSAVMVQPLMPQQVMGYLSTMGLRVEALHAALQLDPDLQELATTPLMLNILTLAYQGVPLDQIAPLGTLPVKQQQIFATYVQRMLARRSATTHYIPKQTLSWLSFLAQNMKKHNQTVFYIEHLQPDWIVDKRMRGKYDWLAVRLPYILVGVLVSLASYPLFYFREILSPYLVEVILLGGLLGWLLGGRSAVQQPLAGDSGRTKGLSWSGLWQQLALVALLGTGVGLSFWWRYPEDPWRGPVAGLSFGICCLLLIYLLGTSKTLQVSVQETSLRRKVVLSTLLVGLLFGLSNASALGLQAKPLTRVVYGLAFFLLGGLSGGLLSVLLSKRNANVQAVDRLIWTWQSLRSSLFSMKHIRRSLQITGIGLLFFGAMAWTMAGTLAGLTGVVFAWLLLGSGSGLCYWLLLGIFSGVASATIDDRLRAVPNQGIRDSALNALSYGLVVAIPVGVGATLLFSGIWTAGLIIGLSVGLLTGLFNGGLACLRHGILRILLWRSGAIPWDIPHFLDAVVERILLSKVGGGYIFLHRLLLDYLAALGANELAGQRSAILAHPPTLLPCGHEQHLNSRFCDICGADVPLSAHQLEGL